jgi:hypothetical protein
MRLQFCKAIRVNRPAYVTCKFFAQRATNKPSSFN